MHVAIDGTPAVNDIRAIQRYTWNLIKELDGLDQEDEFSIVYLGYKPGTSAAPPRTSSPNFHTAMSSFPGKLLKATWRIASLPKFTFWTKGKVDLTHFPGGCVYAPTSGETVVTTLHGFHQQLIPEFCNPVERPAIIRGLRQTIARTDHFITVSENNKKELTRLWGVSEDRITAIPLGISPEFGRLELTQEQRAIFLKKYSLPEKPFLLYVGAIEPHKNIEGLINAYSILGPKFQKDFNLVFIGAETSHSSGYRQMISGLNISEHVFWVNYITPGSHDLAHFYNLAALFVFPTFYEGWASPPLESMKCGVPVLVSNIPSLKESTGGIASYCEPDDPADIAFNIKALLEDDQLLSIRRKAGLEFAAGYTWKRCAEKTLAAYKSLT